MLKPRWCLNPDLYGRVDLKSKFGGKPGGSPVMSHGNTPTGGELRASLGQKSNFRPKSAPVALYRGPGTIIPRPSPHSLPPHSPIIWYHSPSPTGPAPTLASLFSIPTSPKLKPKPKPQHLLLPPPPPPCPHPCPELLTSPSLSMLLSDEIQCHHLPPPTAAPPLPLLHPRCHHHHRRLIFVVIVVNLLLPSDTRHKH